MEFDDCLKRVWLDLIMKHREYARKDFNSPEREKVFKLIGELEAIYPQLSDWYV